MSDVVIEKISIVGKPKVGEKLNVSAVIAWPIDGDDNGYVVNTKKKSGEVVNTHTDEANGASITLTLPAVTTPGTYFVEMVGTDPAQTEVFEIHVNEVKPPNAGFIPIT